MGIFSSLKLSENEKAEILKQREIAELRAESYKLQEAQADNLKRQLEVQDKLEKLLES